MPIPCLKASGDGRRDPNAMCSAVGPFPHISDRVAVLGIDDKIGAETRRVRGLGIIDIDGTTLECHDLGVSNRQVSKADGDGDDAPFAGLRSGFLDPFVGGDACASERCGVVRSQADG